MNWIEEANNENKEQNKIISFLEYMNILESNPARECRPTYEYLIDMLDYFKQDAEGHFNLFKLEHTDSPPIFGQLNTQQSLYQNLLNFREEGFNNKFILLVGPNGSSKSSIVRKFMKGAEEYSMSDHGSLFSFSWVFPIDNYIKGTLGLAANTTKGEYNLKSFAHLEDKDINAILTSELKDHPLLAVPKKHRQPIIDKLLNDHPTTLSSVKKSYLYTGDLSKKNRMIFDALLKSYQGNYHEVLKHIRVERVYISKRYSTGAVTIEPQLHVDARLQQIVMDKRLASLPPSLQSLNLFSMQGELVLANRGILEYSDLLKRPIDAYKYLLMTMETGTINLQGILTELDIFFVGTSNEVHYDAFKQHPDFKSFKGRFNIVKVPYLLNYNQERSIYEKQVEGLKSKAIWEPHALTALCLFSILSRLRAPQKNNYKDSKLATIVTSLDPLEKARFLADDYLSNKLDVESKQIIKHHKDKVTLEFDSDSNYEGKFGVSPRLVKNLIYHLSSQHRNVTFVEVLEYLSSFIKKRHEHDFLNMTPQGDYQNPSRSLLLITNYCLDTFDQELREGLGLIDDRSYEAYIGQYIVNINALIKGEKIKSAITGQFESCNTSLITEFEKTIHLEEDATAFRSHLISKLGAYALDNAGKEIVYCEVFPDITRRLQQSFKEEQSKFIKDIANNLVFYEAELGDSHDLKSMATPLSKENRKKIETILTNLMDSYNYTRAGAITLLKYIIKKRY